MTLGARPRPEVVVFTHVELEVALQFLVNPELGRQAAPVGVGELLLPLRLGEDDF